jgi:hypothetical protein
LHGVSPKSKMKGTIIMKVGQINKDKIKKLSGKKLQTHG